MYKKINNNQDFSETSQISDILTKQLVGRIYAETDISKFRYDMLNYEQDLQKLLKQQYFVTINFCGINSLLVFTKFHDKFYSFTIDRQSLSYNFSKVDFSKTKINLVNVGLDDQIYNGTIFEGILVKRRDMDDLYIISDVYKFCGNDVSKEKLNIKLFKIVEYFKSNYNKNLSSNNIELEVNKLFEISKFDYFYKEVLPKQRTLRYRGICFYPEISDTKLVFMLNDNNNSCANNNGNNNDIKINNNKYNNYNKINNIKDDNKINNNNKSNNYIKINNQNKSSSQSDEKNHNIEQHIDNKIYDKKQHITYVNTSDEIVIAVLEMKSTDNPDVYKLYCVQKQIIDSRTVFKKISMGIAHIKGIEMSHKIKKLFVDKKSLLMDCKFNNDNSKWEPLDINTSIKIPTSIQEIESKLAIVEETNSDDE